MFPTTNWTMKCWLYARHYVTSAELFVRHNSIPIPNCTPSKLGYNFNPVQSASEFKTQLHSTNNIVKTKHDCTHSNVNPSASISFHKIKCQKHNQRESQETLHYWVYFSMFKASCRLQRPPKSILTAEGASHD